VRPTPVHRPIFAVSANGPADRSSVGAVVTPDMGFTTTEPLELVTFDVAPASNGHLSAGNEEVPW
jgi:hypothetical protein